MNIAPYIISLNEKQRSVFIECLSKIQQKKKIRPSDIEALSDDNKCSGIRIQKIFDISKMTLCRWVDDGCPKNADNSYSINAVYKWRMSKAESKNESPNILKDEKLKKEIEFLQARINEKNETTIDRNLHETIMVSRAGSLRTFLEKTFMSNAVHLAGKAVDEVRTILYSLVQQAMEAYTGKSENNE